MARTVQLQFPFMQGGADQPSATVSVRGADSEASKPLAGMLLAAVLSALLVVADQLIDTWANGHLLLVWVVLWTVAFAVLALAAPPLRQLANAMAAGVAQWSQARAQRRADDAMWAHAQTDARIMGDIQIAMTRSQSGD